jgi:hypothetical protein
VINSVGPRMRAQPGSSRLREAPDELRRGSLVVVVGDVSPSLCLRPSARGSKAGSSSTQ